MPYSLSSIRKGLLCGLFCFLISLPHMALAEDLRIENLVIRESTGSVSAGYARLVNTSDQDIKILRVESELADIHELHTVKADNKGVLRMREIPFISIPANQTLLLKPGAEHIMFIDLRQTLEPETRHKIKFYFNNDTTQTVEAPVIPATSLVMKYLNKETEQKSLAE